MLQDKIHEDLKNAQLQRDEVEVSTLRLLLSELNYAKIDKAQDLTDEDVVSIVQKEIKKRKEAAAGFRSGNREESAQKEEAEAKVLEKYLPPQLSEGELNSIIDQVISEAGASSITDMGKVMGIVKSKVGSSADPGKVAGLVKERLSK